VRDDVSDIVAMYSGPTGREHQRLVRHQLEFDLTCHFLRKYLRRGQRVLEVGCGTGRYTVELLKRGVQVTAVDFAPGMLAHSKRYLRRQGYAGKVAHYQADARDMRGVPDGPYDAVLLMGPLYHLVELSDRKRALRQAYARLKPGGVLMSAFICRYGILGDLMKNVPGWIEEIDEVECVVSRGRDPEDYPRGGFRGYFADPAEIAPLHESCGFTTVELLAVEPAISGHDLSYNRLRGKRRELWFKLLARVAAEKSTVGASRHLLYIGRKARAGSR
jgi:S-adenosylmethionine-dependent methyltransferase